MNYFDTGFLFIPTASNSFDRPSVSAWAVHTTDPSVEGKSAIHLLEKSAVPVEISASEWHSFQKHNPHKFIRLHMSVYVSQKKKKNPKKLRIKKTTVTVLTLRF